MVPDIILCRVVETGGALCAQMQKRGLDSVIILGAYGFIITGWYLIEIPLH
jgi:hypothetical protein